MVLASCASSSSSGGGAGGNDKGSIKIGVILASTGDLIGLGKPELEGVKLAAENINKAGGVGGRKIKLLYKDDQSSPQASVSAARALISEGVVGIIGPESTTLGTGIEPIVNAAKIPEVSLQGGINLSSADGYVFGNTLTGATVVQASIRYMKAHNISKIGYLTTNDSLGQSGDKYGYPLFAKSGIGIVGGKQIIDPTGSDFSTQLSKVKAAGAQSVFIWASGPPVITAAKNFAALNMPGKLFLLNISSDEAKTLGTGAAVSVVGEPKVNVFSQLSRSDPTYSTIKKFVDEAKKAGVAADNYSANGWAAVHIFADSVQKAGTAGTAIHKLWSSGYVPPYASGRTKWTNANHQGFNPSDVVICKWDNASQSFKLAS